MSRHVPNRLAPRVAGLGPCAVGGGNSCRRLAGHATAARVWGRIVAPLGKESALLFVIYACWIRLGEFRVVGTGGAAARGRWIWHAERWLPFPSERTLQQWALHATWLVRFANAYYIVGHVAPIGVFLVWLYVRHRNDVPHWRNQLAFVSIVGGLIQFVPVAPPRLYPEYGFVDTAVRYGPRVYDAAGFSQPGQLAAMPSMHVAWAMLIAIATFTVSRSRWRWLGPTHAALTVLRRDRDGLSLVPRRARRHGDPVGRLGHRHECGSATAANSAGVNSRATFHEWCGDLVARTLDAVRCISILIESSHRSRPGWGWARTEEQYDHGEP